jgi:hypothetical protein
MVTFSSCIRHHQKGDGSNRLAGVVPLNSIRRKPTSIIFTLLFYSTVRNVAVSIHVIIYTQETGIMKIQNYARKKDLTKRVIVRNAELQKWQSSYDAKRSKIFLEILETGKQGHKQ